MFASNIQPIKIAISAMGGQGGGVLSNWIRDVAEANGYLAQSTSVPGVAQRTGATIYYLEIFPGEEAQRLASRPVLGLTPIPGDVDLLIAAELVEAARALQRGFVTQNCTTLVTTTHRSYTVVEKEHMANGLADSDKILAACEAAAKVCIAFDMEKMARETGSVISAILLGAVAGSGALPFVREDFEAAIRKQGIAVDTNLRAFSAAFERASSGRETEMDIKKSGDELLLPERAQTARGQAFLDRVQKDFPEASRPTVWEGVRQLAEYQDTAYAELYLERLQKVACFDDELGELTSATARQLALWMAFQDTIQVAQQKIRQARTHDIRTEVKAAQGQFVYPVEFLHPRLEEVCDTLPDNLSRYIQSSPRLKKFIDRYFCRGLKIHSGKIGGFLLLYTLASFKFLRPKSQRFLREAKAIDSWLASIAEVATRNYDLALAMAELPCLIKGYGDTHTRGLSRFETIMALATDKTHSLSGDDVRELLVAAQSGEDGKSFQALITHMNTVRLDAVA